MRRAFCKIWFWLLGIALAVSVASCSGTEASTAEAPGPSSAAADPEVAFKQYEKAAKPFECSDAFGAMGDASKAGDIGVMKHKAREYRDVVTEFDAQLAEIVFPTQAQPIVEGMRELLAAEGEGLDALAAYDGTDETRKATVRNKLEAEDAAVTVEGDRLRAALGHPESKFAVAADQLDSADAAFFSEIVQPWAKFKTAIAANDLAGAKEANAMEIEALQRYIDKLEAIDWPPGSFEGQANTLRDHLRGQIEFDRRQTDVATAADIVRPSDAGTPEWLAARAAFDGLWDTLARTDRTARPASTC
jgi:hypothetical protein